MTVKENKITFRQLQRLTVKELIELIPCVVTVKGKESMTITSRIVGIETTPKGNVTVTEEVVTTPIKDTIKVSNVPINSKIKLDKKGYCSHFILGGNNCRSCLDN